MLSWKWCANTWILMTLIKFWYNFLHEKMQLHKESVSFGLFLNLDISGKPYPSELIFWIMDYWAKVFGKIFPFFSLFNAKKCNDRQNLDKHLKNVFTVKQFTIEKYIFLETGARRCSVKKMFLKIVQNSQENTCARASFLIILQAWGLWLYQKIHFVWNRCFKWIFAKFLRAPFW